MSGASATTRERALSDVAIQIGVRVSNLVLGVVVTAVLVRTLGDTGYGQWLTIMTTFQLLGFFTSFGMESVAVRNAAADPDHSGDWVGALMVLRIALTVPMVIVAFIVLTLIAEGHQMYVAGLILLLQFPFSVGSSLAVVHQLRVRNTAPMLILTSNSVLWGALVIGISIWGGGIVALAIAMTLTTLTSSALQAGAALYRLRFPLRASRAAVAGLVRTGAPLGVASMLVLAYARIDQVIVFEVSGASAAGYYGAAYRLLESSHFIPASVLTTLAPVMAASWAVDRERMLRIVTLAAEFLCIGSFGALAFAYVAADPIIHLAFGAEFAPAAGALPILAGAFVFICFGYLSGNLLLVLGLANRQIIVGVIALVANVAGNLLLVPSYGFLAAAWITLVTEVIVVSTGGWFILRRLGPGSLGLGRIGRAAAAAAVLTGLLLAVRAAGGPLGALAATAAVAYPTLLFGLRAISPADVRVLLRRSGEPA